MSKAFKNIRALALGGMLTALCLTIMVLGGALGIGTYACPVICSLVLMPLGLKYGARSQLAAYIATGALSFILVSDRELSLMFLVFFGWYPMLAPRLEKIKKPLNLLVKLLVFNITVVPAEIFAIKVLLCEAETTGVLIAMWAVGNLTFLLYDRLLPRLEIAIRVKLGK